MAYTKAQAEAQKNALLASGQPIPASQHRQFEQVLIEELYDAQSRGNVLKDVQNAVAVAAGDKLFLLRTNGQVYWIDSTLIGTGGGGGGTVDHWRGGWDASGNDFPVDADGWGSGAAGILAAGDEGYLSVGGDLTDVNGSDTWNAYTKILYLGSGDWLVG